MFLENSRYFGQKKMTVTLPGGRKAAALEPRLLPPTEGEPTPVNGNDRLDIMAQRSYQDSTKFWHIADANTEADSRLLIEPPAANTPTPPVQIILVPRK